MDQLYAMQLHVQIINLMVRFESTKKKTCWNHVGSKRPGLTSCSSNMHATWSLAHEVLNPTLEPLCLHPCQPMAFALGCLKASNSQRSSAIDFALTACFPACESRNLPSSAFLSCHVRSVCSSISSSKVHFDVMQAFLT